ncbi:MAG: hypothetical protein KAW94_01150 [Candidatus Thorarchaeota archaeon]|nr:hypothetical protein [Candidatus Thorarchaeota archaeon]
MRKQRICVLPCSGMGKALGSVTREIGLVIAEEMHELDVHLVCPSSLTADVGDYGHAIKRTPTIVIDGCVEKCATKIAAQNGADVIESIFLPKMVGKYRLKPKGRYDIGSEGRMLAHRVSEDVATVIKKM